VNAAREDADRGRQPGGDRTAEDIVILLRARRDLRAFEPLYRRYYRPIFGYCHLRLRDREEAADATSQTFAKALAGLDGFRDGSVAGWLFTIARNVVVDCVRRRRPQVDLDDAGWVPDTATGPSERAILSDQQRALFAAIRQLTPEQRHVVELRLAGLSGVEVAEVLEMSLSAVKSCQFRAYTRLRRLLTDENSFGVPE
jgi:RNA polymerase sigma-70 factor (ECF subfamily)